MIESSQFIDILTEFFNIGSGKAANALNQLFGAHITMYSPIIQFGPNRLAPQNSTVDPHKQFFLVSMDFHGGISGTALISFDRDESQQLLSNINTKTGSVNDTAFQKSVLTETGNIIINAIIGSISNMIKSEVTYSVPVTSESNFADMKVHDETTCVINALTSFSVEEYNFSTEVNVWFNSRSFIDNYLLPK